MIHNPILEDIQSSIHSKPIPWKGLNRTNIVSEEEGQSFETLGRLSPPERVDKIHSQSSEYAQLVEQLLSKDIRDDLVKYLLLFVVEYGATVPELVVEVGSRELFLKELSSLFERNDEQITILTALLISMIATTDVILPAEMLRQKFQFTIQHMLLSSKPDINYKDLGAQMLVNTLQKAQYRSVFRHYESEAVPAILALVVSAPLQVQYTCLLVLWILSFDQESAQRFVTEFSVVIVISDVAKSALKEKIVRVSVAILANLVRFVRNQAIQVLIAQGVLALTKQLALRKWNDEDLVDDLKYLNEQLTEVFEIMTTFEEYKAELTAKKLQWTPVHKNRAFWIENIESFKAHDWEVLKKLLRLVNESNDSVTLAVACHDIAAIINQEPEASSVITKLGGKTKLMELIANQDAEVRYEALKATQKIIAHIFA